jgi:hypothetical protein
VRKRRIIISKNLAHSALKAVAKSATGTIPTPAMAIPIITAPNPHKIKVRIKDKHQRVRPKI